MDISAWLRGLGLERYESAFLDNAVDGDVLPELTETDLERLGVLLGHRKKMLASIAGLKAPRDQPLPAAQQANRLAEGERRQVTVLFADIVGYTALSAQLDPEEVHALLQRFFGAADRIVAEHGGHIDKHIGDSVMAVFGAPVSHGNDPERAALAALAIRATMSSSMGTAAHPIRTHIGVAAGEVVAAGGGSETYREYTVTGDTVNLAARLTDKAGADEILISERVWRAIETKFEGDDAGALSVKGFVTPVAAYLLRGARQFGEERARPIVGRSRELTHLRAALAACREIGRGGVILIRGDAGIGKTRLVREFEHEAAAAGFRRHASFIVDFGVGLDAIRTLVRSLLDVTLDASTEAREAAAASAVRDGLANSEDIVYLNDLLDVPQSLALHSFYDAMNDAARHQGKRRLLASLVKTLSLRQPRLLVVEDMHWADGPTRDHLATLASAINECPAVLAVTARREADFVDARWRSEAGGALLTTIDLGPLPREDALALARGMNGDIASAEQMVDRAGGNPLFLEQLLLHAQEDSQRTVPDSVQALVQARVDRLAPRNRTALQAASVLGQSFPLDALRHLIDDAEFDGAELISHTLFMRADERCLFAHALIRDAVYASLLKPRRREMHRAAAAWYATRDESLRAEHLDRAEDPAAASAYADAAETQAALLRYERALHLAIRGRALASSDSDSMRLGLLNATMLRELGRVQDALTAFRDLARETADGLARCRALIGVASCVRLLGGAEEGLAALKEAERLAEERQARRELADIHYYFGALLFSSADVADCLRHHGRSHEFALAARDAECEARALSGLGDAHYGRGHMRLALEHFQRCRTLCRQFGFGRIEVGSTHMIGAIRRYLSEWRQAIDDLQDAAATAAKVSAFRTYMVAFNILGEVLADCGRHDEAREKLLEALRLAESFDNPRYRAYVLYELGRAHFCAGDADASAKALEEALAFSRKTDMRFIGPRILATLALVDEGRRASALAEGESVIKRGCLAHNFLWYYRDAIEAHLRSRDLDKVRSCAAVLTDFTAADPLPWSQFFIDRGFALADYAAGRRDPALNEILQRLERQADDLGLVSAAPEISAALAG